MRAIRCLVAAVLAAGIVTVVAAQQPGGGRGGFGDVNTLVLTNAALQEELKVTADQKTKLKPAVEKQEALTKKRGELFGKGGKGFDKDAFATYQEESKKVGEEVKKVVDETLTAAQKKRLKQIAIQVMSFQVFNDPEAKGGKGGFGGSSEADKAIMKEVGEALKLSDKQKSSVKGVVDEFNKERGDINKEAGIGGGFGGKGKAPDAEKVASANTKIAKLRKDSWTKIEKELDGTQQTAWKGLVGEPFDTEKLRPVAPKKD